MNIPNETYNSGWIHLDLSSTPVLAHSGNTYTAQANMEIIPGSRWAVILLMGDSSLFWLARQDSIGVNVTRMLAGLPPVRGIPPTDTYIILLVLLVILLLTAVISVRRAARWLRDPALRPFKAGAVLGQLVLPLVVFLGYAYLVLVNLMGTVFGGLTLQEVIYAHPDLGWTVAVSGALALALAAGWIGLTARLYGFRMRQAASRMEAAQQ